jgi:peroxiredoxin
MKQTIVAISWAALALACNKEPTTTAPESVPSPDSDQPSSDQPSSDQPSSASASPLGLKNPGAPAAVGAAAPDFALADLDGKVTSLGEHRGKVVVLEWFNPECPYVKKSHTKGSLVGTADKHVQSGAVWLAINSGAAGKQGHGVETNKQAAATFGLKHPVLLDESGQVGKAYGAAHTPHMYVIDEKGVLVYRGAIDNSPDGEQESPEGGKLVNHVDQTLDDLKAGRAVQTAETKAYGCSVKYASQ